MVNSFNLTFSGKHFICPCPLCQPASPNGLGEKCSAEAGKVRNGGQGEDADSEFTEQQKDQVRGRAFQSTDAGQEDRGLERRRGFRKE